MPVIATTLEAETARSLDPRTSKDQHGQQSETPSQRTIRQNVFKIRHTFSKSYQELSLSSIIS